jgi:hypothetical protein
MGLVALISSILVIYLLIWPFLKKVLNYVLFSYSIYFLRRNFLNDLNNDKVFFDYEDSSAIYLAWKDMDVITTLKENNLFFRKNKEIVIQSIPQTKKAKVLQDNIINTIYIKFANEIFIKDLKLLNAPIDLSNDFIQIQVDDILDKIFVTGLSSLSEEEKRLLNLYKDLV